MLLRPCFSASFHSPRALKSCSHSLEWGTLAVTGLGRLKQEVHRFKTAWAVSEDLVFKDNQPNRKRKKKKIHVPVVSGTERALDPVVWAVNSGRNHEGLRGQVVSVPPVRALFGGSPGSSRHSLCGHVEVQAHYATPTPFANELQKTGV